MIGHFNTTGISDKDGRNVFLWTAKKTFLNFGSNLKNKIYTRQNVNLKVPYNVFSSKVVEVF